MINKIFNKTKINLVLILLLVMGLFPNYCLAYDYYKAGKAVYKKEEYKRAAKYFKTALSKHPNHTKCRYYYAQTLLKLKKFKKAQVQFEIILEQDPKSKEAMSASEGISKIKWYNLKKRGELKKVAQKKKKPSKEKEDNQVATDTSPKKVKATKGTYILNTLESGKVTHWNLKKMPLKVYVEKSVNSNVTEGHYQQIDKALKAWIDNPKTKKLSYKSVSTPNNADIKICFKTKIMKKTGKGFIAGLASPSIKRHILNHVQIQLAIQTPSGRVFTEQELYMTVLHELGHALGIRGHSGDKNDIMFASGGQKKADSGTGLSQRDINTLVQLYELDADISNFDKDEVVKTNSDKNNIILGSTEKRLNSELKEALDYVEQHPNVVLGWADLGRVYYSQKNYIKAMEALKKAIKIDPTYINAIETLAFTYKDSGDLDNATVYFKKLIALEPGNVNFSHNYALFLIENKKEEEAKAVLKALIKINPQVKSNEDIKRLIKYLEMEI